MDTWYAKLRQARRLGRVVIAFEGRETIVTSPATPSERNLGLTLRIFCVLPFATGLMDMLVGLQPVLSVFAPVTDLVAAGRLT